MYSIVVVVVRDRELQFSRCPLWSELSAAASIIRTRCLRQADAVCLDNRLDEVTQASLSYPLSLSLINHHPMLGF